MENQTEPEVQDGKSEVEQDAQRKVDAVVLCIARLIGRQMAREAFERLTAANDNRDGGG